MPHVAHQSIGRIVTLDASEDQGRFEDFMQPFALAFRNLEALMLGGDIASARVRFRAYTCCMFEPQASLWSLGWHVTSVASC